MKYLNIIGENQSLYILCWIKVKAKNFYLNANLFAIEKMKSGSEKVIFVLCCS